MKVFNRSSQYVTYEDLYLSFLVPEELPRVLYDLLVVELGVRLLLAEGQHLPHRHPEGPHVAGCGELTLEGRRRHVRISL